MKKIYRILALISTIAFLPFHPAGLSRKVSAAVQVPETVRIGIFYSGSSAHNLNTAVPDIDVSAEKGLHLGFLKSGVFNHLHDVAGSDAVKIRKDSYFVKTAEGFKEYSPSAGKIPAGERVGPYHVRIGKTFTDLKSAKARADALKQKGIPAFPVYDDSWQVWTGFFADGAKAGQGMEALKEKMGSEPVSVIEPSGSRIAVFSSAGEALVLFGSSTAFFRIQPKKENVPYKLKLNGAGYRGELEVRRYQESDMTVVNILPMEEYLYGVVPCEIESTSHPEALKAQAVAARTYTLNSLGEHEKLGFDLCNSVYCQVYKGYDKEAASSNKAVDDTRGKKITYEGMPAQVFYFASSGGRTESVENVFSATIPYLVSVEDRYESGDSWKYNWETIFTAAQVKEAMLAKKYDLGDITGVTVTRVTPAGRALELVIQGTKDQKVFAKESCRWVLSSLYSRLYTIATDADIYVKGNGQDATKAQVAGKKVMTAAGMKTVKAVKGKVAVMGANNTKKSVPAIPTQYTFTGKGNGHAVGMSQEGAKGMAKAGFTYRQILEHYFQGTRVE